MEYSNKMEKLIDDILNAEKHIKTAIDEIEKCTLDVKESISQDIFKATDKQKEKVRQSKEQYSELFIYLQEIEKIIRTRFTGAAKENYMSVDLQIETICSMTEKGDKDD